TVNFNAENCTRMGDSSFSAFDGCSNLTTLNIGESVKTIPDNVFSYCTGLTSVIIPNSVTLIGGGAFWGCTGLTEVTIPNSVTSIGDNTFLYCTGLTEVTIPNSVTSIGKYAFYGCTGLTEVTIPNSVTSIGSSAFSGCTGLTEVTIPNSVTSIGERAFYNCTGLTEVTIPNSVTSIGESAFYGCNGLTEVAIPNSVTSIGESAFVNCDKLRTVTIGKAVTEIGEKVFDGCDRIKTVNSYAEVPPTIYSNTFTLYVNDNATLHVVKDCKEAYADAKYWEYFVNITDDLRSANYVAPELLQLDKEKITAYVGNTIEVLAILSPDNVTDKFVTWSVSDSTILEIAKVNDLSVEVLVLKEGVANIVATSVDGSNLTATCEVTVEATLATSITLDQTAVTLKATETATLTATVLPETTTDKGVEWSSSDESVATVADGVITAHKVGTATITATTTDGSNLTATCEVTVEATLATSITLDQTAVTLKATESATLTATVLPETTTNKEVVWTSSDSEIASVENGIVTAHKVGTATITATTTDGSNLSATCEVTVVATQATTITLDQTAVTLKATETATLTATVLPETTTDKGVVWTSSDSEVASVENGVVTAHKVGTATITATTTDGSNLTATCEVTVEATLATSITLDQTNITAMEGETVVLTATIYPDDATEKGVVWSVSDATIATIEPLDNLSAKITVLKKGVATITAETIDGSNLSATCTIDVYSDIEALLRDSEDVEYYDLNGFRVENPTRGIYIVKQGDFVRKVFINKSL
ncbi:MAG: leucine-rich repeat protein, partial [Bacteroidaceae bacterium]|nr:leucine-rich repeat protein [Bacteroidaceae bacterium]